LNPSVDERALLVRRGTILLATAQAALWGSLGVFASFGPIAIFELSGRTSMAAVQIGVYYLAAAAGARVAGRLMDRTGRRPGLAAGYVVLAAGGGLVVASIAAGSTIGVLGGALLIGLGAGAGLLGRAAVADMYPPERRGRAVGTLLVAGTIGAVGGPPLAGILHHLAEGAGWTEPLVAPWLLVPVLGIISLGLVAALRPDPRDLAAERPGGSARRPGEILRLRPGVVATVTIAAAQVVMVTFMGVLPVVLHSHGAGEVTVSVVVGLHLAGMFAFSPLIGAALDRFGRRAGLLVGLGLSAAGVLMSLGTGITAVPASGLFLIGVGWSAAYVASTAVVSDLAGPAERAGALGLTDLMASLAAAVGVLSGAVVLEAAGLGVLVLGSLLILAVAAVTLTALGRPAPVAQVTSGSKE
jgi:MFS family permease